MSTFLHRDSTLTKENYPNNQQTCFLANKITPEYLNVNTTPEYDQLNDEAIGSNYSKINVVEEISVTEETGTMNDFDLAADNFTASDFQDAICGEPIKKQIIRLDFTPEHGIDDNEEVIKKCHGFWEFLKEHTELHHLKVLPEKHQQQLQEPYPLVSSFNSEHVARDEYNVREMSAIDWVKKEDIMKNAARTLEQQRYCDHFNEDYCDGRDSEHRHKADRKRRSRLASIKPPSTSKINGARSGGRSKSVSSIQGHRTVLYNVEELVSQMKAWDLQHTKSMEPPHCPQVVSEMTLLGTGGVDSEPEPRDRSCCQLSCIPECPSTAENTRTEQQKK